MSDVLPRLRAKAYRSLADYGGKAREFLSLIEDESQELNDSLERFSERTNPTPREEDELNILSRSLRLNESYNALILISLYALNDLKEYVDALEKHVSKHDEKFNQILERAGKIEHNDGDRPPPRSMIS